MRNRESTAHPPVPIQVVFQGGGAKLCLLMAVCDVLKTKEFRERVQVTRVAGSSAGAIAAAMFGSDIPMQTYRDRLKSIGPQYLESVKTNTALGVWRVFRGEPYFSDLSLEPFFEELFSAGSGPKKVGDLTLEARLYFTDLYSLSSRFSPNDEALAKALAKSCRFPLAFVGFGSGNTDVDGGLSLNLPVDSLKKDESIKGNVIGVSFSNKFGAPKSNLLSYAQHLFSAAIETSVARSVSIIGPQHVFSIETKIGTFDFESALKDGLDVHHDLVAAQFRTWLEAWLKSYGPIETDRPQPQRRFIRPPLSNVPLAPAIIEELGDRPDVWTHALSVKSYDTALFDEHGQFTGKYRGGTIKTFHVARATNIMQFEFQVGGPFSTANLGCAAFDSNKVSLRFYPHVQEIAKPGSTLRSFRVLFLFDQRLTPETPGQPFTLEFQYEADDLYPNLGQKDHGALFAWQGPADEMILAVGFPRSKCKAVPRVRDIATASAGEQKEAGYIREGDEEFVPSTDMKYFEYSDLLQLTDAPERYVLIGRRVRDIKKNQGFGFVIE
jgi:predicted acylesterase/phospholipase RssA